MHESQTYCRTGVARMGCQAMTLLNSGVCRSRASLLVCGEALFLAQQCWLEMYDDQAGCLQYVSVAYFH